MTRLLAEQQQREPGDKVPAVKIDALRFREVGDKHAGLSDHAFGIEPLLELAEKQAADQGMGDMPYPPDYPKMPGEPMRVQPSRARRPTSANE